MITIQRSDLKDLLTIIDFCADNLDDEHYSNVVMRMEEALEMPHIMQFFEYKHLPAHLQLISMVFFNIADNISTNLPDNPEREVALRKLLEAKDAAVRAKIADLNQKEKT